MSKISNYALPAFQPSSVRFSTPHPPTWSNNTKGMCKAWWHLSRSHSFVIKEITCMNNDAWTGSAFFCISMDTCHSLPYCPPPHTLHKINQSGFFGIAVMLGVFTRFQFGGANPHKERFPHGMTLIFRHLYWVALTFFANGLHPISTAHCETLAAFVLWSPALSYWRHTTGDNRQQKECPPCLPMLRFIVPPTLRN